jgi:hypothetical protein
MAVGGGVIDGCILESVGWADNLVLKLLSDGVISFLHVSPYLSFRCFHAVSFALGFVGLV